MPKRVPRETRRAHVELVDIASPYTGTDRVLRVIDGLALLRMYHLGDREMQAAGKYLAAVETLYAGGLHCTLGGEPGSPNLASRTPALALLVAQETIKQAEQCLGPDYRMIWRIIINAETLKQIGYAGHTLRAALGKLADLWFGPEPRRSRHAYQANDEPLGTDNVSELTPGKVAHASRKGVVYG